MEMLEKTLILKPANVVFPLLIVTLVLYQSTVLSLFRLWTSSPQNPTYTHGLLLVAVCAVLFYKLWTNKAHSIRLQPDVLGVVLLASTSLVWLLAKLGHVQIIQQLSLLFLVVFIMWSVLGYRTTKSLAFPILLMLFAIPLWDPLSIYLQHATARAVVSLLNITGVVSVLEDTLILIPAGSFEIIPGCSGLSQFIVALMVASLYTYTNKIGLRSGLLVAAAAAIVSFFTNTLRIYIVVVSGQLTDMQHYFVTKDHWILGWVLFGIGMFIFILLADKYIPSDHVGGGQSPTKSSNPSTPKKEVADTKASVIASALFGLCAIAVGPTLAHFYQADTGDHADLALSVPSRIAGWQAEKVHTGNYRPAFHGPDLTYEKVYRNGNEAQVYLHIAYYRRQAQGKEAVYYANTVYDGENWNVVYERATKESAAMTGLLDVVETKIRSRNGKEKLVWRWYYVTRTRTSNDYIAKLLNIWGTLNLQPDISIVVIAADLDQTYEKTENILNRFVSDTIETLEHSIDNIKEI